MSEENVELHRRGYDAWNRRDLDAWLAVADPEIEFVPLNVEMEGGRPYRGLDAARRFWDEFLAVFPDLRVEVDELRDLGEVTVARVRLTGRGAGSDVPVERPVWHIFWWRNKKCVRWQAHASEAEALEAAGLSE
jgi:ketosteroid isomerase-like protein